MMDTEAQEHIGLTKDFLLKYNPSKINSDNQHQVLNKYVAAFQYLLTFFNEETGYLTDKSRLLVTDTFSIWILRTTQVISNKKIDAATYFEIVRDELLVAENCTIIFQYILDFWVDGNSAFLNSLKDMFSKFLHLLKKTHPPVECDQLFTSWLRRTLEVPSTLSVQYYLIDALAGEMDLYAILQLNPHFVETSLSFMWSDSLSNPIGRCLSRFLLNVFNNHYKKEISKIDEWLSLWQNLVTEQLKELKSRKAIELYVLTPVFRDMPNLAFTKFVRNTVGSNHDILLSLFRLGQELGIEEEPFHLDRLIKLETISSFLKQDNYKLNTFELLTFSTKKSRPIHPYVFTLIQNNIKIFFVDVQIETRNYFCSSFKHFIHRIRDSAYSSKRTAVKLKKANKFPAEQEQHLEYIHRCKSFLEWLLQYLKIQICPGTQYQRNDVAFKLLRILVESGVDDSIPETYIDMKHAREYPFSISIFESSMIRLLFDCLASNYVDIRLAANDMLSIAFDSTNGNSLKNNIDWAQIRKHSEIFLRVYQYSDIGAALQNVLYYAADDKSLFVNRQLDMLQGEVAKIKRDLVGNISEPISGYFSSINMILSKNQFTLNSLELIVDKCITQIFNNWEAIRHIICHESNEENLALMYPDGDIDSQFILSTAFRTTKESSALLNTLIQRYPLSGEQLGKIGQFSIDQLFNIRHSGAFQSVSPSFQACCYRCRKEHPSLLEEWLKDIIGSLEVKTQNVTRRSGGIPLMLTVILATETTKERPLLRYSFENLRRIASTAIVEHQDKVDLPQVNAFNCIKAIFTESKLSEACDQYIPSGLSLALNHFTSDSWAFRNCSIMLFTALQNRIFGKKGKSVSARLFFTRYKGIRETLLDILRSAGASTETDDPKQQSQVESIFLVLSLLLRLKPTPGYGGLDDFIDEIVKCLGSSNWNIRELSARALCSLTEDWVEISGKLIRRASLEDQNSLHGYLMAVTEFLRPATNREYQEASRNLIKMLFDRSLDFLSNNKCYVTTKAYLSLMEIIMEENYSGISQSERSSFVRRLGFYFIAHNRNCIIDGSKQLCLATALRMLLKHEELENVVDLCELGVASELYEVQKVAIAFIANTFGSPLKLSENVGTMLEQLALRRDILPAIGALSLKALLRLNGKLSADELLSLIENPINEEVQLAAIENFSQYYKAEDSGVLEKVVVPYSQDGSSKDFRLACFECLARYPEISRKANLLLQMHRMLSDDDESIRLKVAHFLNGFLFPSSGPDEFQSPAIIAESFESHFAATFTSDVIALNVLHLLREFFDTHAFSTLETQPIVKGLFELEQDNQFKNEIEQSMHYIRLLQESGHMNTDFRVWICTLKDDAIRFIKVNRIVDGPFGWASSPKVFSRLCILRALLGLLDQTQQKDFDKFLVGCHIHPLVFVY